MGDAAEGFSAFVDAVGPRLREGLVARYGLDLGADCAAEALAWGWANWSRVSVMENPAGYLYRVGQSAARRLGRRPVLFPAVDLETWPWVEPGLPSALDSLSARQRTVVVLVHCFGWTHAEVAELIGVSRGSVQRHNDRAMRRLRESLGVSVDDRSA